MSDKNLREVWISYVTGVVHFDNPPSDPEKWEHLVEKSAYDKAVEALKTLHSRWGKVGVGESSASFRIVAEVLRELGEIE